MTRYRALKVDDDALADQAGDERDASAAKVISAVSGITSPDGEDVRLLQAEFDALRCRYLDRMRCFAVRSHTRWSSQFCKGLSSYPHEDAVEGIQRAFCKVWFRELAFRASEGPLQNYLWTIAKNETEGLRKQRNRDQLGDLPEPAACDTEPEDYCLAQEAAEICGVRLAVALRTVGLVRSPEAEQMVKALLESELRHGAQRQVAKDRVVQWLRMAPDATLPARGDALGRARMVRRRHGELPPKCDPVASWLATAPVAVAAEMIAGRLMPIPTMTAMDAARSLLEITGGANDDLLRMTNAAAVEVNRSFMLFKDRVRLFGGADTRCDMSRVQRLLTSTPDLFVLKPDEVSRYGCLRHVELVVRDQTVGWVCSAPDETVTGEEGDEARWA